MAPSLRSVTKRVPVAFGSLGTTARLPSPRSVLTKIVQPFSPVSRWERAGRCKMHERRVASLLRRERGVAPEARAS